jgi:hypothetical protein
LKDPVGGAAVPETAITVVAAMWLEAWAVRRAAPRARIVVTGIGLRGLGPEVPGGAVIVCGLAGGLRDDLPTGAVVVPDRVLRPDGTWLDCDPPLVEALAAAARRLNLQPDRRPLATATALVRGRARARLAARGCVAVDMETGRIAAPRVAAVRTILDTPAHEISDVWQDPLHALLRPAVWGEAVWLGREAPRCARRAAAVLAAALPALHEILSAPDGALPARPIS